MKKIKPIYIIIAIVALIFFIGKGQFGKQALMAVADVSTATVSRSMPTSVKSGDSFTTTYTASGLGIGSWGVLVEDNVTGGCTPTNIYMGWLSSTTEPQPSDTKTVVALGTQCSFSGIYTFEGSIDKSLEGVNSIVVCTDDCSSGQIDCVDTTTKWTCGNYDSDVCFEKQNTACAQFQVCNVGNCEYVCGDLKSNAISKIVAWASSPTTDNKMSALSAIGLWAANC